MQIFLWSDETNKNREFNNIIDEDDAEGFRQNESESGHGLQQMKIRLRVSDRMRVKVAMDYKEGYFIVHMLL